MNHFQNLKDRMEAMEFYFVFPRYTIYYHLFNDVIDSDLFTMSRLEYYTSKGLLQVSDTPSTAKIRVQEFLNISRWTWTTLKTEFVLFLNVTGEEMENCEILIHANRIMRDTFYEMLNPWNVYYILNTASPLFLSEDIAEIPSVVQQNTIKNR